jgi:hypothetical protein
MSDTEYYLLKPANWMSIRPTRSEKKRNNITLPYLDLGCPMRSKVLISALFDHCQSEWSGGDGTSQ